MTQNKLISFVQEGIGAFLAYLPSDVALTTLRDFIDIIEPQAKKESSSGIVPREAQLVSPIEAVIAPVQQR